MPEFLCSYSGTIEAETFSTDDPLEALLTKASALKHMRPVVKDPHGSGITLYQISVTAKVDGPGHILSAPGKFESRIFASCQREALSRFLANSNLPFAVDLALIEIVHVQPESATPTKGWDIAETSTEKEII